MDVLETIAEQPISFSELIAQYHLPKTKCNVVFP